MACAVVMERVDTLSISKENLFHQVTTFLLFRMPLLVMAVLMTTMLMMNHQQRNQVPQHQVYHQQRNQVPPLSLMQLAVYIHVAMDWLAIAVLQLMDFNWDAAILQVQHQALPLNM